MYVFDACTTIFYSVYFVNSLIHRVIAQVVNATMLHLQLVCVLFADILYISFFICQPKKPSKSRNESKFIMITCKKLLMFLNSYGLWYKYVSAAFDTHEGRAVLKMLTLYIFFNIPMLFFCRCSIWLRCFGHLLCI